MINKIIGLILAIIAIFILGLIALLGVGIASFFLGWWTLVGIATVIGAIGLAVFKPSIKIWIPILIIGIILLAVEYIEIV